MKMRVSIARALATSPKLLLMDEPFAALDEMSRDRLNEELLRLRAGAEMDRRFVTHSVEEAVFLSSQIIVLAPNPGPHPCGVSRSICLSRAPPPCAKRPNSARWWPQVCACLAKRDGAMKQRLDDCGQCARRVRRAAAAVAARAVDLSRPALHAAVAAGRGPRGERVASPRCLPRSPSPRKNPPAACIASIVAGVLIALLFAQSRWVRRMLYPYTLLLQTVPSSPSRR